MGDLDPPEAPSAPPPRGRRQRPGRAGSAAAAWLHRLLGGIAPLALAISVAAAPAQPTAADPELEARVMTIAAELRCLVCQNQTIADSHAGLAIDLRNQVREMLRQGKTREDVIAYMTARYGDFVLYRPPLKESTALLWLGPALLFAAGFGLLVLTLRKRARTGDDQFEPDPEPEVNDHRG